MSTHPDDCHDQAVRGSVTSMWVCKKKKKRNAQKANVGCRSDGTALKKEATGLKLRRQLSKALTNVPVPCFFFLVPHISWPDLLFSHVCFEGREGTCKLKLTDPVPDDDFIETGPNICCFSDTQHQLGQQHFCIYKESLLSFLYECVWSRHLCMYIHHRYTQFGCKFGLMVRISLRGWKPYYINEIPHKGKDIKWVLDK